MAARLPSSLVLRLAAASRGGRRVAWQAVLLLAGLLAAGSALALITGSWTTSGTASATTTVNGITVTFAGTVDEAYSNGTFNTTNRWNDPYGATVSGGTSLTLVFDSAGARNYVVTFSKPVDNPVLHIDRIGGFYNNNLPNSTRWELTAFNAQGGAVTLERLAGNTQFVVDAGQDRFYRATGTGFSGTGSSECSTNSSGTGCGSVRFNGTGITSLTFRVDMIGSRGDGDELELRWSFPGSSLIVRKQSVGGTGTFPFTTSGALTPSFSLTTTAQNTPVSSTTYPITNHAAAITVTESSLPSGYVMSAASCTDQDGATVPATVNTTTRQVTIAAATYGTGQTITCTFTNSGRVADVSVVKSTTAGDAVSGQVRNFTVVVSNAGPAAADGSLVSDTPGAGLSCPVAGTPISCTASGGAACPGAAALPNLVSGGVAVPTLPSGGTVTFTVPCQVTATGF